MSHIFISHSSKDAQVASALVSFLEAHGHRCWIAPRDIALGMDYTDVINNALEQCHTLIFLISQNGLDSQWTKKEVTAAMSLNKKVLPIKIGKAQLSSGYLFMLNNVQIIDAVNDTYNKFPLILGQLPYPSQPQGQPYNVSMSQSAAPNSPSRKKMTPWLIGGIASVALIAVVIALTAGGNNGSQPSDSTEIVTFDDFSRSENAVSDGTTTSLFNRKKSDSDGSEPTQGSSAKRSSDATAKTTNPTNAKAAKESGILPTGTTAPATAQEEATTVATTTPASETASSTNETVTPPPTKKDQQKEKENKQYENKFNSAISLYIDGQYQQALKAFEDLHKLNPSDSRPVKYISLCKKRMASGS